MQEGNKVCVCLSIVLTAAVTQASLQSMLHQILTAGPSAFNITTILSQAAQLSNQGKCTSISVTPLCAGANVVTYLQHVV